VVLAPALVEAQQPPSPPPTPAPAPAPGGQAPADQPASYALRVGVDLASMVDNEPEATNGFQYLVVARLSAYGLRVDSNRPVGDARYDGWIQRKTARWEKVEPNAPPAQLTISGSAGCTYDNAEFFGQGQAHNYKGKVDVSVKDASGTEVAHIALEHTWGRLPQQHTKSQTLQEYDDMLFTGVVLALLHQPAILAGIPQDKRAELDTWTQQQKERLLAPLQASNMGDCQLAVLLNGLPTPAGQGAPGQTTPGQAPQGPPH
jgi:hypothetical protein